MYVLLTDNHGEIKDAQLYTTVGSGQGELSDPFSITEQGDQLEKLDNWYKQRFQRPLDFSIKLPSHARIFLHPDPLVTICKQNGLMLHCVPQGEFTVGGKIYPEKNPLAPLNATWASVGEGHEKGGDGTAPHPTNWWVPPEVLRELNEALKDEDSAVRRISSWPIIRTFVYLDISDFSKFYPRQEALVINSLVRIINTRDWWRSGYPARLFQQQEAMLCIGDGYIFVFREAIKGTYFAAYLATLIETLVAKKEILPVRFHFRMGVHVGPVYSFWDPGRKDWNYIGEGINGGNRVLAAVGKQTDDVLYISGQVREAIMAEDKGAIPHPQVLANLHNRGRQADKHGNPWRVYELSHTALCRGDIPLELWF